MVIYIVYLFALFFFCFVFIYLQIAELSYRVGVRCEFPNKDRELICKKLFDFIFENKPLNHNLSKLISVDDNAINLADNISISANDNLTIEEIMTAIDTSTNHNANKLFFGQKEKLFRLNLVNYCCTKFLKYTIDQTLMENMALEMFNDWNDMTFTKIEESCGDRQYVLSKKC